MDAFRHFARKMFRYWWLIALALTMVTLSGVTLGAGMLGARPVLASILGEAKGLNVIATEYNDSLKRGPEWLGDNIRRAAMIPESWIAQLPSDPFVTLVWIMSALAGLTLIGATANFFHAYFSQTVVNRSITAVRREAFHAALRSPLRTIVRAGPTDTISRIVNDSSVLANGLNILLSKAVLQVFKGVVGLGVALYYHWQVSVVALLVTPILAGVIRKVGKRIKKASRAALQSQSGLYAAASESLGALKVVKVHTTERYEAGRFHRMNKQMLTELNKLRTAKALASPLNEALSILMLCAMVLILGRFIIARKIDPADFILAIGALAVAGASLKPLTNIINDIQTSAPAAERLKQLLDTEQEPGHNTQGAVLPRLPRHTRSIEFDAVRFTYPNAERPALDRISLTIGFGTRVAIVGTNGSGKTTLLAMVARLFDPDEGRVLVDGRDIREVAVRSLREQIAVVTQEVILFKGTVRTNILYGSEFRTSNDQMIEAAKRARAHAFIEAMPSGYETPVAEMGLNLSGGQRQRIAIARAILRDPAILIFDEATSMIDTESEAQISQAIAEFSKGRTCIIVAHRMSTVLSCDTIVVMDAGRVIDQGSHAELLNRCLVYRTLAGN